MLETPSTDGRRKLPGGLGAAEALTRLNNSIQTLNVLEIIKMIFVIASCMAGVAAVSMAGTLFLIAIGKVRV